MLSRVLRTSATSSDRIPAEVPQTVLTIPISVIQANSLLEQVLKSAKSATAVESAFRDLVLEKYPNEPGLSKPTKTVARGSDDSEATTLFSEPG